MKGIILLGGSGTRLHPATRAISKQLIPIYDKPMCYYPLSTLFLANIREILIITTPQDLPLYEKLLDDGSQWGVDFTYKIQHSPDGLTQAFTLGENFIGNDNVCMILGDNVFYGHGLTGKLERASQLTNGMRIFARSVKDPQRFGIVEVDKNDKAISLEEKPKHPKSNLAITGLYFCDNDVIQFAKNCKKSARGEYEIVDVMKQYLAQDNLYVERFGRGQAWLDTGTHSSLLQAANFVCTVQEQQECSVACLEEIAFKKGWIDKTQLQKFISTMNKKNPYAQYLQKVLNEK